MGAVGLEAGTVALIDFGVTVGREQSGVRPGVVITSSDYSSTIDRLTIAVPCTTVHRGWLNHVELTGPTGLSVPTYALTEQHRTISTQRVLRLQGRVDERTLNTIARWVHEWIHEAA